MWIQYLVGREFKGRKWESEPIVYLQLGTQDDRHDNNTNDLHDITSIW